VAWYSDAVVYRSPAFRVPDLGLAGVRRYLSEQFPAEQNIQCWFGEPIASGDDDRASVEWWASWTEDGQELTFAGVTVLRFDEEGKVVDHRDHNHASSGASRRTQSGRAPEITRTVPDRAGILGSVG
jgi:hypothetical protein